MKSEIKEYSVLISWKWQNAGPAVVAANYSGLVMTTLHPHMTFSKIDQNSERNNLIPWLDSEDFSSPSTPGYACVQFNPSNPGVLQYASSWNAGIWKQYPSLCVWIFLHCYPLNLCAYVKSQLVPEAKFIIAHKAMCYILIS